MAISGFNAHIDILTRYMHHTPNSKPIQSVFYGYILVEHILNFKSFYIIAKAISVLSLYSFLGQNNYMTVLIVMQGAELPSFMSFLFVGESVCGDLQRSL